MGARTLKSSQPLHTLSALAGREQRIEKTDLELLQGERGWTERIMGEGSRCRGAPYPRSPRALHSHRYAVTVTDTTREHPQTFLDISPSPKHAINTDKKKFLFPGSTFFFPLEYKQKNGNKYE